VGLRGPSVVSKHETEGVERAKNPSVSRFGAVVGSRRPSIALKCETEGIVRGGEVVVIVQR